MMYYNPLLEKLKRGPQVILPKDIGMILAHSGVGKESIVIDAGAGSGWLAISLANVAKKVYTYEWKEDFADLVKKNIARAGFSNVVVIRKDVFKGFKGVREKGVDLITLDLAESNKVVKNASKKLKSNGCLVGYLPHVEQVKKFVNECEKNKFTKIFTLECITREMLVREQGIRPDTKGLWHTAYLVFARKI
ncbi:MAG: methyltransferase domain-containing protein [Candidatus Micrarchaeota archaeon]